MFPIQKHAYVCQWFKSIVHLKYYLQIDQCGEICIKSKLYIFPLKIYQVGVLHTIYMYSADQLTKYICRVLNICDYG